MAALDDFKIQLQNICSFQSDLPAKKFAHMTILTFYLFAWHDFYP